MRNEFVNQLIKQAEINKDIFLLCGDLGYSVLEPFAEKFPDRYINVGIAEQNMVGIAAGLALTGKKVFTYSIVNFAIARCLEQIRNDICYHNLDVTVVAVGGGMPYGSQGYTHLGVEDIALTRNLPNMRVYSPADRNELKYVMDKNIQEKSPGYLRLGRGGEPDIHQYSLNTEYCPYIEHSKASKLTVFTTGAIASEALKAINKLPDNYKNNISLVSVPEISHNSRECIKKYINQNSVISHIITLEEHLIYGGFGSFIAEILTACNLERDRNIKQSLLGVQHENLKEIGNQDFLKKQNKIDAMSINNYLREYSSVVFDSNKVEHLDRVL